MKTILIALLGLVPFAIGIGAAQEETTHMAGQAAKTPGHPGYVQVGDKDKAMVSAVEHAQRSLGFFMAALHAKKPGDSNFEIKKPFVDGDKVEHLWINDVTYDGRNFHGKIDNQPLDVKNVRLGERVTVAPSEVSDWMFLKDGKLMGGYTTRVLYARLSPEEKAQFDQKAQFKIE
ncbi:MAG: YegJ family protein [Chthoniobacterales bacterium]